MTITYETFATHLVERVPELAPILEEHRQSYGETLNHVLVGEVVAFLDQEPTDPQGIIKRTLDFIEQAAQSTDERVTELIRVSFMEILGNYTCRDAIVPQLGPASRKLFDAAQW